MRSIFLKMLSNYKNYFVQIGCFMSLLISFELMLGFMFVMIYLLTSDAQI